MSERGIARVNGHRLAYEITDFTDPWRRDVEAQVWVHGFMGSQAVFRRQVPSFCRRFRVATYDQRGFGESSAPKNGSYGIDDYIADLKAFTESLGIRKFHLVGHSFGGMVSQGFAVKYPKRLLSLTLIATKATSTPEDPLRRKIIDDVIMEGGMQGFADAFAAAYADPSHPEISQWNLELTSRNHPHVVMANAEGRKPFDYLTKLKKVTCPALVLATKADKLIPADEVEAMAQALPHATLHWYEGSHGAPLKAPQAITAPMLEFYDAIHAAE